MFVKKLLSRALPEPTVPVGHLKASLLEARLTVHHGVPATASVLAFDSVQRLLAVGTRDGRIKLFGGQGCEGLLRSPSKAPLKFLEFFVNQGLLVVVTTHSDVEVWDLTECKLKASCKWDSVVTAVAVCPGTPFLYLGDETGILRVLKCDREEGALHVQPYCVPPHITLGGLVKPGSSSAPSLISIIPQPQAECSRILLTYANGLMVLWSVEDNRVVAVRGASESQRAKLAAQAALAGDDDDDDASTGVGGRLLHAGSGVSERLAEEEEEEETLSDDVDDDMDEDVEACTATWACGRGTLAASGDGGGHVALWSFPPAGKPVTRAEAYAPVKARQVAVTRGSTCMPITTLRWSGGAAVEERGASEMSGGGGRLYVLGGNAPGAPETVTVATLSSEDSPAEHHHKELPWFGPVADTLFLPGSGPSPSAPAPPAAATAPPTAAPKPPVGGALAVLTSPGMVHLFEEASVAAFCGGGGSGGEGGGGGGGGHLPPPSLAPVLLGATLAESNVTVLGQCGPGSGGEAGAALEALLQTGARLSLSGPPSGAEAFISGGSLPPLSPPTVLPHPAGGGAESSHPSPPATASPPGSPQAMWGPSALLTGHKDGSARVWDARTPGLVARWRVPAVLPGGSVLRPVSAMAFCPTGGVLAVGHDTGVVRLYRFFQEPQQAVVCHTWSTIGEATPTISDPEAAPVGFHCVAELKLHKVPVRCIALASGLGRLASGDEEGMLALVDLHKPQVLSFGPCAPSAATSAAGTATSASAAAAAAAPVVSLAFTASTPDYPGSPRAGGAAGSSALLLACTRGCVISARDALSGRAWGPGFVEPQKPSAAIAMHVLLESGEPLRPVSGHLSLEWATRAPAKAQASTNKGAELPAVAPQAAEPQGGAALLETPSHLPLGAPTGATAAPSPSSPPRSDNHRGSSQPAYVLLCAVDCLRLYSLTGALQADRTALRKLKLPVEFAASWYGTFGVPGLVPNGLITLSQSGELSIRSLPDLGEVDSRSLKDVVGWPLDPGRLRPLITMGRNGRIAVMDGGSELLQLSLMATENSLDLPQSLPRLHDPTAVAAPPLSGVPGNEHAAGPLGAAHEEAHKKKGLMNTLKTVAAAPAALGKSVIQHAHSGSLTSLGHQRSLSNASAASSVSAGGGPPPPPPPQPSAAELGVLFSTRPFTVIAVKGASDDDWGLDDKPSGTGRSSELDIDDLDMGEEVEKPPPPEKKSVQPGLTAAAFLGGLVRRVSATRGPVAEEAPPPAPMAAEPPKEAKVEEKARAELFEGASSSSGPPRARTAAEIRAAYGRGKPAANDAANAASMARDRLVDRGEKLQQLQDKTAKMESDAANFANLASELAKQMEKKSSWW